MKRNILMASAAALLQFSAVFAQFDSGSSAESFEVAVSKGVSAFDVGGIPLSEAIGNALPLPVPPAQSVPPASLKKPLPEKKWTVMVFMNSKNNLELAGLYNMNMMEKVGSDENMNIVVEMGRMSGQAGDTKLDGNWTGVRRYFITKDDNEKKITSKALVSKKNVDMGDYRNVVDFIKWSKTYFPAKRYVLILWNHGLGFWDPAAEPAAGSAPAKSRFGDSKGISFDDATGNYIRTRQIGQIFREAGKVDILMTDACLMQMAEVAFEVKDGVDILIGSEELVPGLGQPYDQFLGQLRYAPVMSTERFASKIVESFNLFYEVLYPGQHVQLSAIRTSKLDGLAVKAADFAVAAMEAKLEKKALKAARTGVIRYDVIGPDSDAKMTISFYADLAHFAQLVAEGANGWFPGSKRLRAAASDLDKYITDELVINASVVGSNRVGKDMAKGKGLAIYLPPAETKVTQAKLEKLFETKYSDFAFDKATGWHNFVTYLYGLN